MKYCAVKLVGVSKLEQFDWMQHSSRVSHISAKYPKIIPLISLNGRVAGIHNKRAHPTASQTVITMPKDTNHTKHHWVSLQSTLLLALKRIPEKMNLESRLILCLLHDSTSAVPALERILLC